MKKLLVILLIVSMVFGVIYFTAFYKKPEPEKSFQELDAEFDAQIIKIEQSNEIIKLAEEYFSLRNSTKGD